MYYINIIYIEGPFKPRCLNNANQLHGRKECEQLPTAVFPSSRSGEFERHQREFGETMTLELGATMLRCSNGGGLSFFSISACTSLFTNDSCA